MNDIGLSLNATLRPGKQGFLLHAISLFLNVSREETSGVSIPFLNENVIKTDHVIAMPSG